ncbi:MAG: hypothetical protein HYZ23_00060 [Chloroflexi bacterium]|nr:hypothetical protein [Chloroflexota bacterium]
MKGKPIRPVEIIALPPLRMTLVHSKKMHLRRAAHVMAIKKIALEEMTIKENVTPQAIRRIIRHLEKRS